jgi:HD-like signal output (HDOD) protein
MIPEIKKYQEALQKHEKLNPNMRLVSRLYAALRDDNCGIEEIARLLATDGALTAKLLSLCNSAYFGAGEPVEDIPSAIQNVGLQEVARLVGMVVAGQLFMRDLDRYGMSADDYWGQSLYCALFLEKASRPFRLDPLEAYLVGLLHAIGRVVINEMLIDAKVEIFWDPSLPAETWEGIMVGRPYDEAGADLLARWKLPESVCKVLRHQNDAQFIRENRLAALLHVARLLVETNRWDFSATFWEMPSADRLEELLQTTPEVLQELHSETVQALRDLQRELNPANKSR